MQNIFIFMLLWLVTPSLIKLLNIVIKRCDWFLKYVSVVRIPKYSHTISRLVFKIPKYSHVTLWLVFKIQPSDWFLKFPNMVIKRCDWWCLHGDVRFIVVFIISFIQFFRDLSKKYRNSWRKQLMSNIISNKIAITKSVSVLWK